MGYNWLFQIIIGYYNGIFFIFAALSLACVFFLEIETTEKIFFSDSPLIHMSRSNTRSEYS